MRLRVKSSLDWLLQGREWNSKILQFWIVSVAAFDFIHYKKINKYINK